MRPRAVARRVAELAADRGLATILSEVRGIEAACTVTVVTAPHGSALATFRVIAHHGLRGEVFFGVVLPAIHDLLARCYDPPKLVDLPRRARLAAPAPAITALIAFEEAFARSTGFRASVTLQPNDASIRDWFEEVLRFTGQHVASALQALCDPVRLAAATADTRGPLIVSPPFRVGGALYAGTRDAAGFARWEQRFLRRWAEPATDDDARRQRAADYAYVERLREVMTALPS